MGDVACGVGRVVKLATTTSDRLGGVEGMG